MTNTCTLLKLNISGGGEGGIASFLEEESDPSVFVMSPSALESLNPEDAAAALEGMVNTTNLIIIRITAAQIHDT